MRLEMGLDEMMPMEGQAEYFAEMAEDWFDAGLDCRSDSEMVDRMLSANDDFSAEHTTVWIDVLFHVRLGRS